MSTSVFLNFPGPATAADAVRSAVDGPLHALTSAPGLVFIETYRPVAGDVPAFQDGPGAPLLVEFNLESPAAAGRLLESSALREAVTGGEAAADTTDSATVDVFTPVHYPVPGNDEPPPRTAPLSFVVRYYRPVADAAAFVDFYTTNHPPLLAQFPGIRNVLCYVPVGADLPDGLQSSGAFIGNEVVFDSVAALNQALNSAVLDLVKADGRRFAAFGSNTHHAMERDTVYARPE